MTDILISEKHGINPCMGICERCGEDTGEILIPGKINKYTCTCGKEIYGSKFACSCGSKKYNTKELDVEIPRHIPYGFCAACKEELKNMEEEIDRGGIYFKCKCGANGVIKYTAPICKEIRKKLNVLEGPCGIELKKCPKCEKEKKK